MASNGCLGLVASDFFEQLPELDDQRHPFLLQMSKDIHY